MPNILLAGHNGAGKSSALEAVRHAIGGDPCRVALKKDFGALMTHGARQAEREPVRQQQAAQHQRAEEPWIPTDEELADIAARERAEAGGLLDSADQQSSQPAPTGRRPRPPIDAE